MTCIAAPELGAKRISNYLDSSKILVQKDIFAGFMASCALWLEYPINVFDKSKLSYCNNETLENCIYFISVAFSAQKFSVRLPAQKVATITTVNSKKPVFWRIRLFFDDSSLLKPRHPRPFLNQA